MLQTRILGTTTEKTNYLTKCVGRKAQKPKRAKVINQERKRDSSSSVAIKTFLDSLNCRYLTVVLKTGNRQTDRQTKAFFTV